LDRWSSTRPPFTRVRPLAARAGRRRGNRRTGQFHFFIKVRHPGNKRPVRYLTTPLGLYGRANGFKVTMMGTVNRTHLP
jgi:hypothetical protein